MRFKLSQMKNKLTIKNTSKWLGIISKVVLVLSVVALMAILVFFMYFLISAEMLTDERIRVLGKKDRELELDVLDLVIYFSVVILFLMKTICISCLFYKYFSDLNYASSPFDKTAASDLKRLGIAKIVLPVVHDVITQVLYFFTSEGVFDASIVMNYNPFPSVSLGAMMIMCAAISMYGAERQKHRPALN